VSPETARPCRGGWRRDHPLAGVRCRGQRQCLWRLQDHVEAAGEGIIFLQEYDVEEESTIFERSRSGDCNIEEVVRAKKDIKKGWSSSNIFHPHSTWGTVCGGLPR